jgi:hypothetical protein
LVINHCFTSASALPDNLDPAMMEPALDKLRHPDEAEGILFRDCKWLNYAHRLCECFPAFIGKRKALASILGLFKTGVPLLRKLSGFFFWNRSGLGVFVTLL